MNDIKEEHLFLKIITYGPLFFIPLFIGIFSYMSIQLYNENFQNNLKKIEENLYHIEKQTLQNKIQNMVDVITYRKSIINKELKARVKERVEHAFDIAKTIYEENINIKSEDAIKSEIKTALKSFIWNNGESYIWIANYNGISILSPNHLEGKSLINFKDANGRLVIKEEIAICKEKGEGFLWDTFIKPNKNTNMHYEQVAFVKSFGHFDWYLGSAEFLDTASKKSDKLLLDLVDNIYSIHKGYVFIINSEGKILLNKSIPNQENKKLVSIDKKDTQNVIKLILTSLKNKNSDFITYDWINPKSNQLEKKYSFIQKIPDSDWIIGSGFYLSDINGKILQQKVDLYDIVYSKSNKFIYTALIAIFISLLISYYLTTKLKKSFQQYKQSINTQKNKLQELNATLEAKVAARTHELEVMSIHDELTKIYNRYYYNKKITELLTLYNRYKRKFSIIMYDIDDFKHINDTYDHSMGDKALIEMTRLIQSLIRENDFHFRIGGEEFIILLLETNEEESLSIAEKIRKKVSQLEIIKNEKITISIGLTQVNEKDNEDSIFKRVDDLLYHSKKNGKNRVSTKH